MMKKNRTIYFLLALVCLGLQSCLFQEEDYFDDSSANRATADVKRCSELLEAAPNGWVMEYYVGKDYSLGGITLLCKFDGQRVTMASQIAGADETVSSLYSVKSEQATMLSFDTYNYLVHYFGARNFGINDDAFSALHNRSHFIADAADDGNFFTIERAVAVEAELPFRRKFITEVHDHCVRFFSIPHGVAHDFAAIKNHFHLLNISNFAVSSAQFIFSYEKADVLRAPASNLI